MPRTIIKKTELCKEIVEKVGLDLSNYNVLTELGTNQFAFLPILASIANAKSITAFVRDTKYGTAEMVEDEFKKIVKETGLGHEIKIRKNNLQLTDISIANIVTNSRMLRPLNQDFISKMRPFTSVITLMYEAWEMRYADIDINACDKLGIKVCGVSENTKMLPIFDFCGPMIAKLVFDAGFEIMSNNIVIFSNDSFGKVAKKTFKALGAASVTLTNDLFAIPNVIEKADFLLLADYQTVKPLLETSGCAPINFLNKYNPELNIIHLFGKISEHEVKQLKGRIFPETSGLANVMTYNLSSCGEIPVFWLQVAGLRAAQEVLEGGPVIFSQDITREI